MTLALYFARRFAILSGSVIAGLGALVVLFETIEKGFRSGADRRLMRLPHHINDEAFAQALVAAWREVSAGREARRA